MPLDLMVTPERNLSNGLFTVLNFFRTHNLKRALDHELGHFYIDQLSEVLRGEDFPSYTEDEKDNLRIRLISEGIATYFEREMGYHEFLELRFEDTDWPTNFDDFRTHRVLFEGSFNLVSPIIDRFGRRGIEYLIFSPPSLEDLRDVPEYRNRVIQTLSK